jgi:hypothetical protein
MDAEVFDPGAGEEKAGPNVNCLYGKRCPKCGSYGPFDVVVSVLVRLSDNGSDDAEDGTIEYDDESPATCYDCHYEAKFGDFDVR